MMNSREITTALFAACLFAVGCQPQEPAPQPQGNAPAAVGKDAHEHAHADGGHHEEGHEHGAGPHDGTLADWGGGKYHVEFTVNHEKKEATVYVLGSDEKTPTPVKTVDGTLLLTINEPDFQVTLKAAPLDGETDGKASRYTGTHESLGLDRNFAGSMSAEIDGTPYAGDFKEETHNH